MKGKHIFQGSWNGVFVNVYENCAFIRSEWGHRSQVTRVHRYGLDGYLEGIGDALKIYENLDNSQVKLLQDLIRTEFESKTHKTKFFGDCTSFLRSRGD